MELAQQILKAISSMCLDRRARERTAAFNALQKVVLAADDAPALGTAEELVWLLEQLLYGTLGRITALTASEDDLRGASSLFHLFVVSMTRKEHERFKCVFGC